MGKDSDVIDITPTSLLDPSQRALLSRLSGTIAGQVGKGAEAYPGTMAAPASDIQKSLFNLASQFLGGESETAMALPQGMGALETVLADYDPTAAKGYWKDIFVEPAMQQWTQDVIPEIQERFAGLNALDSGALMREISKSGANLSTNLSSQLAQMLLTGSEAQKDRQLSGLSSALEYANYPVSAIQGLTGIGETERGITQDQLTEMYQKWLSSQPYSNPWLNYAGTALSVNPLENIVSPNKGFLQEQSMMSSIGGMMGGGGGAGCCFKFRKGKELTKEVRAFRDEFFREDGLVQKGYKIASRFIVPLMSKSKKVEGAVRWLMLKPLRKCAELHEAKDKKSWTWLLAPIGLFWVMVWAMIGALLPEKYQYTWEEYYGVPEGSFVSCGCGSGMVVSLGEIARRKILPFLQFQDEVGQEIVPRNLLHSAFVLA
jgi:hypothetical protein